MASDLKIKWDDLYGTGDIVFTGGDLERDEELTTAVLMSIYTDQRDDDSEFLDDRRGWWGDLTTDADEIGSKVWRLQREKITQENLTSLKQYLEDCLAWMVEDGVANSVEAEVERADINKVYARIVISKGENELVIKFTDLWEAQFEVTNGI